VSRCRNLSDKFWKVLGTKRHLNLSGCSGTFSKKAFMKWAKDNGAKLHSLNVSSEFLVVENKYVTHEMRIYLIIMVLMFTQMGRTSLDRITWTMRRSSGKWWTMSLSSN
jgi:hypothetical protein